MTYSQISTVLNNSIVPAIMGGDYTVNPDLSNLVDLGTKISAMSADDFKSYFNEFVAAVRTVTDTRIYSPEKLPLYVDSNEYGGLVQSIKSDFVEVRDSILYSLVDGETYNDVNKYFGSSFDNKVYTNDKGYQLAKSIPNTMYKKAFASADGVAQLVALIEVWVDNSINRNNSALEHNLISALAANGKRVDLVTKYNAMLASGAVAQSKSKGTIGQDATEWTEGEPVPVTSENCIYNKYFMTWAYETISNIIKIAKLANKKYNDGTVSTWVTESDAIMIFNSLFRNRARVLKIDDPQGVNVYDTPFWNAQTNDPLPTISNCAKVLDTTDGQASGNTEIKNVVGIYYDRRAVGYTTTPIAPRTHYHAQGDFYTVFYDYNNRYWIDTRNTAIVFTLN